MWLRRGLLAILAIVIAYLFWVAANAKLDFYDTYEIFLNAKLISGDPTGWYFPTRAFVFPILLAPLFWIARHFADDPATFGLVAAHTISLTLVFALVWATYRIFRIHLTKLEALFGATLLLLNSLLIHNAPFSKEDLPGALFTTAAFYFYLRLWKTGRRKHYALAALFILFTMGTRYNLIPLIPIVILAHELLTPGAKQLRSLVRKGLVLVGVPTIAWLLIPTVLYVLNGRAAPLEATGKFLGELYRATAGAVGTQMDYTEFPWENLFFLARSYSPPVFCVALWGMVTCLRKRAAGGGCFHGLWLGVFLLFHSFVLGHKEARYLFPLFVPLYFFAVQGFTDIIKRASTAMPRYGFAARATVMTALLAWPAYNAASECLKFQDPFYHENFAAEVSRYAAQLAGDKDIVWLGPFYAMHPEKFIFDEEDEVTYLYHFYVHHVRYYTGKPMVARPFPLQIPATPVNPTGGVFPHPGMVYGIRDGSAVILNIEPGPYVTKSVPERLKPLIVERAHFKNFEGGPRVFTSRELPGTSIELIDRQSDLVIKTSGLGKAAYFVYGRLSDGRGAGLGFIDARRLDHSLEISKKNLPGGERLVGFALLYFDSVKQFSTAGY